MLKLHLVMFNVENSTCTVWLTLGFSSYHLLKPNIILSSAPFWPSPPAVPALICSRTPCLPTAMHSLHQHSEGMPVYLSAAFHWSVQPSCEISSLPHMLEEEPCSPHPNGNGTKTAHTEGRRCLSLGILPLRSDTVITISHPH